MLLLTRKTFYTILLLVAIVLGCTHQPRKAFTELLPSFATDSIYLSPGNEFTDAKATLGRYLFYDRRLSVNGTKACASCHAQEFSFTDNYTRSIGALGDLHQRNARPLINIVFNKFLTAADSSIHFPELQSSNPLFNTHPVELGLAGRELQMLELFEKDKFYSSQFKKAFPGETKPFTITNMQYALADFVKTVISFNSPYDNYTFRKQDAALDSNVKNGMRLFFSDRLHCSACHGGINFNTPQLKDSSGKLLYYFNTGLYNIDSIRGSYPAYDQGLMEYTHNAKDMGKYRVPTLRNLTFTAPYYHDGSAASLAEVVSNYEAGGRTITTGAYAGDGKKNRYKHPFIEGFKLNLQEREDLIRFLLSLSDSSLLKNQAYANPFAGKEAGEK